MTVRAKICGLSTRATIDAAIKGGASHIGLVFFPPSPRHLDFAAAARLAANVPAHVGRVGVFVDPDDVLIDRAIATADLTALQLHKITAERAARLKARTGLKVWAAVAIREQRDLASAARFTDAADLILYDAKTPEGATLPGGMGVRFDWGLLEGFRHPLPWALSGGLTADNIADAIAATHADLIDVSSGVESAPGIKDVDKITAFLKATQSL